jgi:hypothetical protein
LIYLAGAIVFIWLGIGLFLCGRQLNLLRLTLDNLAPRADYWGPEYEAFRKGYSFTRIDPDLFNAEGQQHLKALRQNGSFLAIWMFLALLLTIWSSRYFMTP